MSYERRRQEKAKRGRLPMSSRRRKIITDQKRREKRAADLAQHIRQRMKEIRKEEAMIARNKTNGKPVSGVTQQCDGCGQHFHPSDLNRIDVPDEQGVGAIDLCSPCRFDVPPEVYEGFRRSLLQAWGTKERAVLDLGSEQRVLSRKEPTLSFFHALFHAGGVTSCDTADKLAEHMWNLWWEGRL